MPSPNLASVLCYLCSLRRYWSFLARTLDSCSRFLKNATFLVETRQSDFTELSIFSQTIWNAIDFRFFWKKETKKNKQWFWNQNRNWKYLIVWNNLHSISIVLASLVSFIHLLITILLPRACIWDNTFFGLEVCFGKKKQTFSKLMYFRQNSVTFFPTVIFDLLKISTHILKEC